MWSIAQCLDHLVATARAELPAVRSTIAEGRSRQVFGHGGLLGCIRDANGLDLARTKVPILYCKYIRLSLGQEFKLFVVHEQRHILQAQRISNALR